jgi:hypothetical protein
LEKLERSGGIEDKGRKGIRREEKTCIAYGAFDA